MRGNVAQTMDAGFGESAGRLVDAFSPDNPPVKAVKSPLRYPGGKSRAAGMILNILPGTLDSLASPFIGGGSVELALASRGARVYGYDAFPPLALFWQRVISEPAAMGREARKYHPLSKEDFYALQGRMKRGEMSDKQTAVAFFVLNRASFSGTTLSGGMSPGHPRFTESAIERLESFRVKGLSVELAEFHTSIPRHDKDFLYCDPPYANGGALYGRNGDRHLDFDHVRLAKILTARDGWVLSYNDCAAVRDLYSGFTFLPVEWTYGMNGDKQSNETLILSKDLNRFHR